MAGNAEQSRRKGLLFVALLGFATAVLMFVTGRAGYAFTPDTQVTGTAARLVAMMVLILSLTFLRGWWNAENDEATARENGVDDRQVWPVTSAPAGDELDERPFTARKPLHMF